MPFAVATVALISAQLLAPPAARATAGIGPEAARPVQRPGVADLRAAAPDREADGFRLKSPYGPAELTDLAVYVGQRDHGAQFEFGALGGGRADAPGLVHVGIGWDF